jgi:glutamate dehydrogenase
MINRVGSTFVHRLADMTGMRPALVVRAYLATREVFGHVALWQEVEALDSKVPDQVQSEMLIEEGWLTARATTWFLRSRRLADPMEQTFKRFRPVVDALRARVEPQSASSPRTTTWIAAGVPAALAQRVASADGLYAALDITEIAEAVARDVGHVADVHVGVGTRLGLAKLRQQIDALPADSYWQSLAAIAQGVFSAADGDPTQLMAAWEARNTAGLERAQRLLAELGETKGADLAMLSVALRELRNLA